MGRVILRVKDFQIINHTDPEILINEQQVREEQIFESNCKIVPLGELCRICHSEEHNLENPLLSVCKCTGSLQFVHYKCLKTWLNYKLTIKKQTHIHSYFYKSFECEICKCAYPLSVKFGSITYKLVEIIRPLKSNFVQLETFIKDNKAFSRIIHVLIPDPLKPQFKIGRGHDSDVKIPDISVSRDHANILLTEKGYILEDNNSKFGTLILLPESTAEIDKNNGLSLQIGRTMLTFSIRQKDAQPSQFAQNYEEVKINERSDFLLSNAAAYFLIKYIKI